MLVFRHIDALALESHPFHLKPRSLLQGSFELQLDLAAGADHALPRQRSGWRLTQQLRNLSMIEWISRGGRNLRVGGYFAFWNLADRLAESGVSRLALGRAYEPPVIWDRAPHLRVPGLWSTDSSRA